MGFFDFFRKPDGPQGGSSNKEDFPAPEDEQLQEEVLQLIKEEITFGFKNEEEIVEAIWAAGFENEEQLDEQWLRTLISTHYAAYQLESRLWTRPTDFDKLAHVFDELNRAGIIALHQAGYTKQDGISDVREVVQALKAKNIEPLGFCFYHTQDLQRAIHPDIRNLFLAFDDIAQDDGKAVALGKRIVEKLHAQGLKTAWDGTVDQRIELKNVDWKKLPDGQDWGMNRALKQLCEAT
ncbi:DUF6891 domain-containing protein [Parapedobacter tibetensis]|uniref:DUF6891 domain-containing protein n=1 Tax=Parapedobacter tibetensis TaxID=2972951 RepID=UPI00214D7A96|nr:hypothetical protein [Parapedobacter tibetensis]